MNAHIVLTAGMACMVAISVMTGSTWAPGRSGPLLRSESPARFALATAFWAAVTMACIILR